MEFLGFLRALSLEPVSDSVIKKMIGTVVFQGSQVTNAELGPELTNALARLLSDDPMDYQDIDEMDERNGSEVALFGGIKLPEINTTTYLTRRLEHNVVILTKNGSGSWRSLERELVRRMQQEESKGDGDSEEGISRREIFAISWAVPSNGGDSREAFDLSESESDQRETEENECNQDLLKVTELLEWVNKDSNPNMPSCDNTEEEDQVMDDLESLNNEQLKQKSETERKKHKLLMDIKMFLDPYTRPPGKTKLRFIELDAIEKTEEQFDQLCCVTRRFTVHWLQAFPNGGFILKKTRGPLRLSRIKLDPISYQEENWLPYLHKASQHVICISGIAGMGKSTFLDNLARELKRRYKNRLICSVNLQELSVLIDYMDILKLDMLNFPNLLVQYFGIETELEKNIFKTLMSSYDFHKLEPNVELLMDGLDRMSEKTRKILVDFWVDELSICDSLSYRIWLTTRPHLKHKVEEAFSIVAYELDLLNSMDLMHYLVLRNDSADESKISVKCNIAKDIFSSSLKACLKIDLGGLLGAPERMIAFEAFLRENNYPNLFDLNTYVIMGDVLMKSLKQYYADNFLSFNEHQYENSGEAVTNIVKKHIPLAINVCSGENGGPTEGIDLITLHDEEEEAELLAFGILTKNKEGKLYFTHAEYPAYLLADFYRNCPPDNGIESDFFLQYVLGRDACDLIRQFYEQSLDDGMNDPILLEWMVLIRKFLIETYRLSNDNFDHDEVQPTTSVIQLSIIDERPKIAKLMLWSFAYDHLCECRRLIKRKVRVEISDTKQCASKHQYERKRSKISQKYNQLARKVKVGDQLTIELSTLSLSVMLGDSELVKMMYLILGEKNEMAYPHMTNFTKQDHFHYTPLHLAVMGCNPKTFEYLRTVQHVSSNTMDARGHLPIHLLFFNRWVLRFPSLGLRGLDIESEILREVHICKYYEDKLDPDWNDRIGQTQDRAGHLPLLSSRMIMGYIKRQMKTSLNFSIKRANQPWKICYYRSSNEYVLFADCLTGKTKANHYDKVPDELAKIPPPFHLACGSGYIPIIETMLNRGAKLNIRDKNNRTALYHALCKEQLHVAQYLLERGIERDMSLEINEIPLLHHLSVQNKSKAINFVVQELDVPVDLRAKETLDNCTPLHLACIGGCLEATQALLELGASVNAKDDEQYTPLLHAVHPTAKCNLELVKYLLEKGADVNTVVDNEEGRNCLHQAVVSKNLPLIKCLLECAKDKLNVNAVTNEGQSALHLACKQKENCDMLELLVQAGATVDLVDKQGQTPLYVFCIENYADVSMGLYLVKQGACMFQRDKTGQFLLRQLNKRNSGLGDLLHNTYKQMKQAKEKANS